MGTKQNFKYTTLIDHAVRIEFGLSITEYCVAEFIRAAQTDPSGIPGWWLYNSKTIFTQLAKNLSISKATAYRTLKKLKKIGVIEFHLDYKMLVRTTKTWYDAVVGIKVQDETEILKMRQNVADLNTPFSPSPLTLPTPPIPPVFKSKDLKQGNPDVEKILKEFAEETELSQAADKRPRQWAYLFGKHKGVEHFLPCLRYLQNDLKLTITKIETIYRQFPLYQRDILKITQPKRKLTPEVELMMRLHERASQ